MSDFDRKLDELRRGTEPLRAPEDFDAVMTAKLVAAAALPPAAAGAGLALSVRLVLAVLGFSVAAGGVWWATQGMSGTTAPHVDAPPAVSQGVVPGVPNVPVVRPSLPPREQAPSTGGVVTSAIGPAHERGTVEAVSGSEAVPAEAVPGKGASTTAVVAVAQAVPVLVPSGKVMSCGRSVDRVDLVARGPSARLQQANGPADSLQRFETALAEVRASHAETVALGHFVVDGGPGVKGVAGDVRSVLGDWFIISGRTRTRVEVVVNEYRPVALALDALGPGEFYVGDVQLNWVGAHPADEHGLKVLVQGTPQGESARVRLFPMACGAFGEWKPSVAPALDVPAGASDTNFQHLSPTRYRVAAYAPGAEPAWTDQSVYDVRVSSAVLRLSPEEAVNVEYASGGKDASSRTTLAHAQVMLSRGWQPAPALEVRFVPGGSTGQLCFELPDGWVAHDMNRLGVSKAHTTPKLDALPFERCLSFDRTVLFESPSTGAWVSARFTR